MDETVIQRAQRIAEEKGIDLKYLVVCPDHGADGPFSTEEQAQEEVDRINQPGRGHDACVYKVLPLFPLLQA